MMNAKSIIARLESSDWQSPSLGRNKHAKLSLKKEAEIFAVAISTLRSKKNLKTIRKLAEEILLSKRDRVAVAVPAFVGEQNLKMALQSMARAGETCGDCLITVLLNADSQVSKIRFAKLLDQRLLEIASIRAQFPQIKIFALAHHSVGAVRMGTVRGLLVDAIALAAQRVASPNLIVISNDADQLGADRFYISRIKQYLDRNPIVDAVDGDVSFGTLQIRREMPEIVLNELVSRRIDVRPNRRFIGPMPTVHGWGANSAFQLSSYCAVGGYNYRLRSGEDIELLQKIEVARVLGRGRFVGFFGRNIRHLESAKIVTDPRNLVSSILKGKSIYANCDSFFTQKKAKKGKLNQLEQYKSNSNCLQKLDLHKARLGNAVCIQKIHQKIIKIYLDQSLTRDADAKLGSGQTKKYLQSTKGKILLQSLTKEFLAVAVSN